MAWLSSCWIIDFLILALAGSFVVYWFFKRKFSFWRNKNVPLPGQPSFPYGHFAGVSTKRPLTLITRDLYNQAGDVKFFGCYFFTRPIFMVKDLDLAKVILVKDFSHFHDRGFSANEKRDPLAGHLFLMNGQEWRNLRVKLTPTFTSGKMRMMFPTLLEVGKQFQEILNQSSNEEETEIKDVLARYTTDVISSCAFGIQTNSLKNPEAEFRKMGVALLEPNAMQLILGLLLLLFPKTTKYIPIRSIPKYLNDFFINAVRETMEYREKNNVQRGDFMQLMIQLKNLGYVADVDGQVKDVDVKSQQKFTVEQAAANAFLFFFAGFESTAATMIFALYELALNPELQTKVQNEIDDAKEKNGELTYDTMMGMDLMDRVVSETLRKYPFASVLIRECNDDYSLPDSNVVLKKGSTVWISVYGIHHDPKLYPDPEKFIPDRFLPAEKEKRHSYAYLPFGEGPRNCIGNRFALMQIKVGLNLLLQTFSVSPSKQTPIPLIFDPKRDMNLAQMYLKLSPRVK